MEEEKKIRISHEAFGYDDGHDGHEGYNGILITASTSELQQYLIKYSDEPEAYESEKIIFKK